MLSNIALLWSDNNLDDGFYISKIASLPYVNGMKNINYVTGLFQQLETFDSYLLNTGELEQSVYIYILSVEPTVYLKLFLSIFHYFLFCCCIYAITNKIIETCEFEIDKKYLQYTSVIAILFSYYPDFLVNNNLLIVQDSWQFNTAMFYGSSIVRTMGILLIFIPFINNSKIYMPDILAVICLSIVLISKSTIAIPLIFITCFSYLIANLFYNKKIKYLSSGIFIFLSLALVSYLLPQNIDMQQEILSLVIANCKLPIILVCIVITILSFTLKSPTINKLNLMMLIIFIFIVVNPFSNLFDLLSMYNFVAKRVLTTFIYTYVILNFIYLLIMVGKLSNGGFRIKWLSRFTLIIVTVGAFVSTSTDSMYNLLEKYSLIIENQNLVPNSTVNLAKTLDNYYLKTGQEVYMVMLERTTPNLYIEASSVMMRTFSQHIYPITAITRYGVTKGNKFSDFSQEDQQIVNNFISNTFYETYKPLNSILDNYPINCIVTINETKYLSNSGFELYDTIIDEKAQINYYIYIK